MTKDIFCEQVSMISSLDSWRKAFYRHHFVLSVCVSTYNLTTRNATMNLTGDLFFLDFSKLNEFYFELNLFPKKEIIGKTTNWMAINPNFEVVGHGSGYFVEQMKFI